MAARLSNLHLHSLFSDGMRTPEAIVREAARLGLGMLALTDHDTMGGTARFARACRAAGIVAVAACEVDVDDPAIGYDGELLAYFPGGAAAPRTEALLARSRRERLARMELLLAAARVQARRADLTVADMVALKQAALSEPGSEPAAVDPGQLSFGKVDLFMYLKARGALDPDLSYKKFRKDWFDSGRIPVRKIAKPDVAELVAAVRGDGGLVVIPHIGHLWDDDAGAMLHGKRPLPERLRVLRRLGVEGVERYWYGSAKKSAKINGLVAEHAAQFGYFFTFGSDCHGPGSGKETLADFSGPFERFPIQE